MYLTMSKTNNELFQRDLDHLSLWAKQNGMSFNTKKCQSIFFSRQPCSGVQHIICGERLERADSFRYLGIILSEDLLWDRHITGRGQIKSNARPAEKSTFPNTENSETYSLQNYVQVST
jgi:hypothetical protein